MRSAPVRIVIAAALLAVTSTVAVLAEAAEMSPRRQAAEFSWPQRVAAAKRFAAHRRGEIAFAVVDEAGTLRGYHVDERFESASVIKVMLLCAYLRQGGVRHRALTGADRNLLAPMIKRSANEPASTIYERVGAKSLYKIAKEAGMKGFSTNPVWGSSQITARGQAHFLYTLENYIPKRHRDYALRLLTRIVPSQRWGIPAAVPNGFHVHFKGGWAPEEAGWKINQVALLTNGDRRLALAVLTRGNPSAGYGHGTVRGVAERLLRGYG
ncbi:MAG TPA: serine hydrolase [Solirubrobacterales bacterium]|nr:serine hydrolase [Solirubrobacterales bacterium]